MAVKVSDEEDLIPIDRTRFRFSDSFEHFRRAQYESAELAVEHLNAGADIVAVEATVGFGKTGLLEIIRQWMKKRMLYVAPHIELQRQFLRSFPYAKLLVGRANYPHGGPDGARNFQRGLTCADCRAKHYCKDYGCPYQAEKQKFCAAGVGVTNMSYWLAAANYLNMFKPGSKEYKNGDKPVSWDDDYITAFDEGDCLERVALGFLEVALTQNYLKMIIDRSGVRHSLPVPPVNDFCTWPAWWMDVREIIDDAIKRTGVPNPKDTQAVRWYTRLCKIRASLAQVELDWIYDPIREVGAAGRKTGPAYKVTLKPSKVGALGASKIWDWTKKTVVVSGSIINVDVWKKSVGLDLTDKKVEFIRRESDWDPRRSSIHRVPGVEMVKKYKKMSWSKQPFWDDYCNLVIGILLRFPNERTLIHTHSHELAEELGRELQKVFDERIVINYKPVQKKNTDDKDTLEIIEFDTESKNKALAQYIRQPGAVLVTASASRGIDLPDDLCRNIIIAKVPFANLGDRGVEARMNDPDGGDMWYMVQAVMEIVQSCGRGCRHRNDWVRIWVVDDKFDGIVEMRGLLPPAFASRIRRKEDYITAFK